MPHVVCQPCLDCKYTDCVVVCPVEAFRDGGRRVYIDPAVCIDCGSCVGECPLEAIYPEDEVPPAWREFIGRNAEMAPRCAAITENKTPLAEP